MTTLVAIGLAALLLVAVLVVLVLALMRSRRFRVEGTLPLRASVARVYAELEDFGRWQAWSAWSARDPALVLRLSGARAGLGAACTWSGDRATGSGSMEVVHAVPPQRLVVRIVYRSPRELEAILEFETRPRPDGNTDLDWAFHGPASLRLRMLDVVHLLGRQVRVEMSRNLAGLGRVLAQPAAEDPSPA